jgi:hypothetical protein
MLVVVTACALLTANLSASTMVTASNVTEPLSHTLLNNDTAARARAGKAYGELPLQFERNKGQADERFDFISRAGGYSILLSSNEAVFALREQVASTTRTARTNPLLMKLVGARQVSATVGEKSPGRVNYFKGSDAGAHLANVPAYTSVSYKSVYEGVDLVYYGNQRSLEYDFVVAPGADAAAIKLEFDGYDELELNEGGDLSIKRGGAQLSMRKPLLYQESEGKRRPVAGRYVRAGEHRIGFEVGEYDRNLPLVIDPVLGYSTFFGGEGADTGTDIQVDAAGNAYITGSTTSTNFPLTANAIRKNYSGQSFDIFVTKLNAAGTAPIFSTYLGGANGDSGSSIALDKNGNVYVAGITSSPDFPTTEGAFDRTLGGQDFFVTKLNPAGDAILYSTYLGGTQGENRALITLDSAGDVYLAGNTYANDFPTTPNAFRTTVNPYGGLNFLNSTDGVVAKIHPAGAGAADLVYSTYLGGTKGDGATRPMLDSQGFLYVVGFTSSPDFPVTPGALKTTPGFNNTGQLDQGFDGFVAKLDLRASGPASLVYSTYLGGTGDDECRAAAVGKSGDIFVSGTTRSGDFPVTRNALQTQPSGGQDAFVIRLDTGKQGSAGLAYATYLGGEADDGVEAMAVDTAGNAYVAGSTRSTKLPVTVGAFQPSIGGVSDVFSAPGGDGFVAKLNAAGTALVYFSYFGGAAADYANGIALDSKGNAYLTGLTFSTNLPLSSAPFQTTHGGSFDAYVARIDNPSSFAAAAPAPALEPTAYTALATLPNPIDDSQKFVRQQYLDFLNREPDADGLAFWTGEIEQCGADAACREVKRINVSAAFFLSIEFQQTGYLVHRLYRATHARAPRLTEFAPDTRLIREGVVVNVAGWEQRLEANKRAFVESWVQRSDFRALYDGKSNVEYVDALFANAGLQPSAAERTALVDGLGAGTETRATVLRKVAENDSFARNEFNKAFVLMQYFGYLQRSPDDPPDADLNGYNFWLSKLDEFDGNFVRAEMVKAFLSAGEYRKRFGQE